MTAPNLVERALKKAILHRKNSLFYKPLNGADVGDLYMSLIHTCELNGVNPFEYLTELQRLNCSVMRRVTQPCRKDTNCQGRPKTRAHKVLGRGGGAIRKKTLGAASQEILEPRIRAQRI